MVRGPNFISECVDMVEKGIQSGVKVTKITIDGIYKEEIFKFSFTPTEEGYDFQEAE